jgi:hypothetical protein
MVAVIIIAVVLLASAGWTAWSRFQVQGREAQIPVMAASKGLHFAKDDPFNSKVLAFSLFQRGDGSRLENVVWSDSDGGPAGLQARVFDFGWYQVHHNRNGGTYQEWHWSTCALAEPDGSFPDLQVQRRSMADRALELVGGDPIHFESEEFNDTFHVSSQDRRFASALIDPQMMQFLLGTKGLVSFATMGRFVLATAPQVAPDEMPILLGLVGEFVRRIPPAVWELYPKVAPDNPDAAVGAGWKVDGAAPADPANAWDPTPGVDYDLDGHPVHDEVEDPWHDHPLRPPDPRPPDRME